MANVKISALPAVTTVSPSADVLPLVSAGVTTKATPNQIINASLGAQTSLSLYGGTWSLANSTTISAASTKTLTLNGGGGSNGLVLDASNNVGIGLTPKAWSSSVALQLGTSLAPYMGLAQMTTATADGYMLWGAYLTGNRTFAYSTTGDSVCGYRQVAGTHAWLTAGSGTAGAACVFNTAMTLDSSGNLGIGISPANKLHVYGDGSASLLKVQASNTNGTASINLVPNGTGNGQIYTESGALLFSPANTERMRLDSSGNLGLGVTPSAWVQGKVLEIGFPGNSIWGRYQSEIHFGNNYYGSAAGRIYSSTNPASDYQQYNGTHTWFIAPSGTAGNAISFTQAMTLDASGCLGIGSGATSPSSNAWITSVASPITRPLAALYSNAASDSASALLQLGKYANDSTTANLFVRFYINNLTNGSGTINANGAGSAAFGAYSDARLKENIVDLEPQLSNILALRPTEFDYIESEGGGHQIGFIAQDMEKVYPDAVGEREDGMKTITGWSKTEARLVKAIQELTTRLEALEARLPA